MINNEFFPREWLTTADTPHNLGNRASPVELVPTNRHRQHLMAWPSQGGALCAGVHLAGRRGLCEQR